MALGQEPTIQMVFCHQNTWSDRWHMTHYMTWENHIKSNVSSPKSTSSRIIRFSPVFSRAHSCLKSSYYGVDLRIAMRAACGARPAGVAGCAVKFAPGVTMFRAWKQVMKELGQKFGGQKTPKMDRLENPEETVMFWNPTCNFFKLRSSILGDSESARAIANVAGLSMQRGCGLSFLAIDSVAKPAMSGLQCCFFSQYESKNHPWLVMICIILYSCVLSCS